MTAANYPRAEALVTTLEGGYVNSPKDPGGPTNMGVTLRALCDFRGHACTVAQLKALTHADVLTFYREVYWTAVRGDALPGGVDLITFDAAVNCGRGRAVTFLQQALGGLKVDGQLGPATMRALSLESHHDVLVERIRYRRAAYYRALSTYPTFGAGWLRRLETVAATANRWTA